MENENGSTTVTITGDKEKDFINGAMASQVEWGIDEPDEEEEDEDEPAENENANAASSTTTGDEPDPKPTPDPVKPAETTVTPANVPIEKPNFDEILANETGGKIKTKADLEAILSKKDLAKFPDLEKMYDHFEGRGTLDSYLAIRQIGDPAQLSDLDAVRKEIAVSNPDLLPEEIEAILDRKYTQNESRYEESDINAGKALLKLDATQARQNLSSKIADLRIPQSAKDQIAAEEKAKLAINEWNQTVSAEISKFNKIELEIPESDKPFVFDIPKEDIPELEELAKEMITASKLANKLAIGTDGKFSLSQLFRSIYLANPTNLQKVVSAYGREGKARGIGEVAETIKNTAEPGKGNANNEGVKTGWESVESAMVRHFNGQ